MTSHATLRCKGEQKRSSLHFRANTMFKGGHFLYLCGMSHLLTFTIAQIKRFYLEYFDQSRRKSHSVEMSDLLPFFFFLFLLSAAAPALGGDLGTADAEVQNDASWVEPLKKSLCPIITAGAGGRRGGSGGGGPEGGRSHLPLHAAGRAHPGHRRPRRGGAR